MFQLNMFQGIYIRKHFTNVSYPPSSVLWSVFSPLPHFAVGHVNQATVFCYVCFPFTNVSSKKSTGFFLQAYKSNRQETEGKRNGKAWKISKSMYSTNFYRDGSGNMKVIQWVLFIHNPWIWPNIGSTPTTRGSTEDLWTLLEVPFGGL